MTIQNRIFLFLSLFFLSLTVFSIHIPFFWDGTFFSFVAVHFYNNGFNSFIAPLDGDTGGFPLYSSYLTLCWKIFGKSLNVSHFAILPFLIGIAYEYLKLCKRFLNDSMILFCSLLLICAPVFLTQAILMGYDILMVFFFLLSVNYLLEKKDKNYSFAIMLLGVCSIRGILLGISLLIIDVLINKLSLQTIKKYLFAGTILISWTIFHFYSTGWFFISPLREDTHESLLPFPMMIRQFLFIVWKLNDFGRIFLWLFLFVCIFRFRQSITFKARQLLLILLVPATLLVVFMMMIANPAGHKYYISVFLILNIAVCYFLQDLSARLKNSLSVIFITALVAGNFMIYPEKLGNGWDSSLKILPYFELQNEMDEFVIQNKIDPAKIGTQYPLIADKKYSRLIDSSFSYTNVWSGPVENYEYFLLSNIINTDIPEQTERIKKEWIPIKELKKGLVYITLYKNPESALQHF